MVGDSDVTVLPRNNLILRNAVGSCSYGIQLKKGENNAVQWNTTMVDNLEKNDAEDLVLQAGDDPEAASVWEWNTCSVSSPDGLCE
jgi:hypothetical protein